MDIRYFQGENIVIKGKPSKKGVRMSEMDITKKYLDGTVRIVTEQARYPLNSILTMLNSGDYELHPEFQRRRRWNRTKQSRLIESFIMNVPIPPIFLYEQDFATYEVMDGLQRLTAISDFYKDKFELVGLEFWPELEGYKYSTLPKAVKQGIDRRGGIGPDGHLAFNEPGSSLSSRTRIKTLTTDTIHANSRFFDGNLALVPKQALTVGIGTVMDAKEVLLVCNGHNKARALKHCIDGDISHKWTSSMLQMHPHAIVVCDEAACDELSVGTYKYYLDKERGNL